MKKYICIIIFAGGAPLLAAPPLEKLLVGIVENHARTRALLHELRSARHSARLSGLTYPDPEVMAERMEGRSRGATYFPEIMPEAMRMKGSSVRIEQPIPFPGKLSTQSRQAHLKADQAEITLAMERNDLSREALSGLARYAAIRIEQGLARAFVVRSQVLAQAARTRYAGGKGNLADVAAAQVRQARYQDQVLALDAKEKSALAELAYLVGDEPALEEWKKAGSGLAAYTEGLLEQMARQKPDDAPAIRMARLEESMQVEGHKLARQNYLPDFSIFASMKQEEERLQALKAGTMKEDTYSVGLSVRVPLWTALGNHENTRSARENVRSAQSRLQDAQSRLKRDLAANQENLNALKKRRALFRSTLLPQARAARESALISYETARADFSMLINTWDMLYELEAEAARLEAEFRDLVFARAAMLGIFSEVQS